MISLTFGILFDILFTVLFVGYVMNGCCKRKKKNRKKCLTENNNNQNEGCEESGKNDEDSCQSSPDPSDIEYDLIVQPAPLIINTETGGILELFNGLDDKWLAVRILTRTPNTYDIFPQKHLIPPRRRLSTRIALHPSMKFNRSIKTLNNAILIEYYELGEEIPFYSCNRPWVKPYLCAQTKWRYKIALVFYENDID